MPSDREELLDRLRHFPERVARIVDPQPIEALRRAGANGGWGAVEILAHLRDWDEVTLDRVRRIVHEDTPELENFDTGFWAIERDYHAQDPRQVLAAFRARRARLVALLESLPDSAWQRTGRHPRWGTITLEELVQRVDEHDQKQLRALRDVLT
ncbi:MAG: DinB family protein [Sphaerobacter sp.]|nr:DinB family protein [Sphaerobacter sp.]